MFDITNHKLFKDEKIITTYFIEFRSQ